MKYEIKTENGKKYYNYIYYKILPPGVHKYCYATEQDIKINNFTNM